MEHPFDVIVVGGGHAGCEAALAAARIGARTAIVTLRRADFGVMSCNPAIGGLGKGHLVREIDALDGAMGRAADAAGIQFRLLNRRKGPAVRGPRAQADRALYARAMQIAMRHPNLTVVEGEVARFLLERGAVRGVGLADGSAVPGRTVVLTTGTFLRGVIHIGDRQRGGGRMGSAASVDLARQLVDLDLPLGRLKTGTPPRLVSRTIDWERLEAQPGDSDPAMFSFLSPGPAVRQVACGIAHTNAATHAIIRDNLSRSAMYGGHIAGQGPRYCPSIEDKVVRFADKDSHQIFLEPEGLTSALVYPNGISTSLPADVQAEYVASIAGLERAEIRQPGYAIEYDYVDPRALSDTLALPALPGLFLAGQINGTTGYEEAAAQGLVAGLNAARTALGQAPVRFSRATSYIGVLIDDLVTRGVTEPYRMFTSRAEYRLHLRADNADQRLTPTGIDAGLVGPERRAAFDAKMERLARANAVLDAVAVTPTQAKALGWAVNADGRRRTGRDLISQGIVGFESLAVAYPQVAAIAPEDRDQIAADLLYAPYLERQAAEVARLAQDEAVEIPGSFDYGACGGLSSELRGKLERVRPRTLGQAGRIDGMTPAALVLILAHMRRLDRKAS